MLQTGLPASLAGAVEVARPRHAREAESILLRASSNAVIHGISAPFSLHCNTEGLATIAAPWERGHRGIAATAGPDARNDPSERMANHFSIRGLPCPLLPA